MFFFTPVAVCGFFFSFPFLVTMKCFLLKLGGSIQAVSDVKGRDRQVILEVVWQEHGNVVREVNHHLFTLKSFSEHLLYACTEHFVRVNSFPSSLQQPCKVGKLRHGEMIGHAGGHS